MFFINFQHYYMFCFRGHGSYKKMALTLAVSLHILSTRVGEMRAHAFLIRVASHWP
jgi:hypothetical protein